MAVGTPALVASVAETTNLNTAHVAAVTVAVPVSTFLLVTIVESVAAHTHTCTDSKSNTWTPLTKASNSGTQPLSSQFFWTVVTVPLTTSDTITVTSSAAGNAVVIAETLDSVASASPIDVSVVSNTGTSSAWASTAISPSVDSMVYIAGGIGVSTASYTGLTAGYTQSQKLSSSGTGNRTLLSIYKPTTATGSTSAAATLGTATNSWSAMAISIKAAVLPELVMPPSRY